MRNLEHTGLSLGWALILVALPLRPATVKGVVVDHVGATQPAAKVELRDANSRLLKRVKTADDGRFEFADIQSGHYFIFVIAPCFKQVKQSVQVGTSTVSQVNVRLGPQQQKCSGID